MFLSTKKHIEPCLFFDSVPKSCPYCRSKVKRIIYGYPTREARLKARWGMLILGGCNVPHPAPAWGCRKCGTEFYKK